MSQKSITRSLHLVLAMFQTSRSLGTNIFSLRYKHSISIELKNRTRHLKEHPKISKFTKFDGPKGIVHLVWIGGTGVLQSILSSLILKVYHAFAFKPITIKFGEFTNFWMLFQMTCPIFNSIDIKCLYQEKICSYPVPCSFRTWPNPPYAKRWRLVHLPIMLSARKL